MDTEVQLTGRRTPPTPTQVLHAGPVTCELDGIELRDVRHGEAELANLVFVAVRDEAWNTIPAAVDDLSIIQDPTGFRVTFRARNIGAGMDLSWAGIILGTPEGSISYAFDGVAANDFRYNRIGFNVLHSVSDFAGRPYRTSGGDDGVARQGTFPVDIAPQRERGGRLTGMLEPFRRLEIDRADGLTVTLDCSGDEFETEDQRNFADATFKTYSTPLQRPAPLAAVAGDRITQQVRIGFAADASSAPPARPTAPSAAAMVTVDIGDQPGSRLPTLGLGVASDGLRLAGDEIARVASLHPGHLRVVVDAGGAGSADVTARLASASADAIAVGARLEVELLLGRGGDGLERAAGLLAPLGDLLEAILVRAPGDGPVDSGTPAAVVVVARERLSSVLPGVPVGSMVGTLAALNRAPVDAAALGMVGVPFAPTVHRDDDRTVMENLLGLDQQVRTAADAVGGRPVRVGPVTLATVNGPWPAGRERPGGMPPQVDVRQPSLFTAAWSVGALAGMLVSGATSVTLYETTGWRGVMERRDGSAAPDHFLSTPGAIYPVWHVLADLAGCRGGSALAVVISDPRRVAALAATSPDGPVVLVANLTRDRIDVLLRPGMASTGRWRVRMLDVGRVSVASAHPDAFRASGDDAVATSPIPLSLSAYAVASLQWRPG